MENENSMSASRIDALDEKADLLYQFVGLY